MDSFGRYELDQVENIRIGFKLNHEQSKDLQTQLETVEDFVGKGSAPKLCHLHSSITV